MTVEFIYCVSLNRLVATDNLINRFDKSLCIDVMKFALTLCEIMWVNTLTKYLL